MTDHTSKEFDVDLVLNTQAIYTLFGAIDTQSVESAIRFILAHNCQNKKKHIMLIVNSQGGDLNDAFALIDVIQHSKMPIHTMGLGQISSSGLMIFMAGAKGHRVITPNTHIMSHQWSGTWEGKIHEMLSAQEDLRQTTNRVLRHYETHSTLTKSEVEQYLLPAHDVYLTAEQAVHMGIADKIQT